MRGYGIVSRTCSSPQIHPTTRSMPMPKPACGHRAVPAQVEIPLERLARQLVLLDALHEQVVVGQALAAADDLAVAFRRQHVHAQRLVGLLRIGLHVERLDRGRVAVHARPADRTGPRARSRRCRPDRCRAGTAAPCRSGSSPPRRTTAAGNGAFTDSAASSCRAPAPSVRRRRLSSARPTTYSTRPSASSMTSSSVGVRHLGLDHPELGEVPARLRLLGAERRAEAIHAAERHRVGLVVQLPALREVRGRVLEVLDREQVGRALAGRRREDRRVARG